MLMRRSRPPLQLCPNALSIMNRMMRHSHGCALKSAKVSSRIFAQAIRLADDGGVVPGVGGSGLPTSWSSAFPFSDPLADGIVNQLAAQRALAGGSDRTRCFGLCSAYSEGFGDPDCAVHLSESDLSIWIRTVPRKSVSGRSGWAADFGSAAGRGDGSLAHAAYSADCTDHAARADRADCEWRAGISSIMSREKA